MKRAIFFTISLVLLCSCNNGTPDPAFTSDKSIHLSVKGNNVFTYTEGDGQIFFNRGRAEFGAGNDDMSEFFTVTMDAIPSYGGSVTGTVKWNDGKEEKSIKNIVLKTVKAEDDMIWLWNSTEKVEITVCFLD